MTSNESVKGLLKLQTLKQPRLAHLDMVLYKWLTAIFSESKHMTGVMTTEKKGSLFFCTTKVQEHNKQLPVST